MEYNNSRGRISIFGEHSDWMVALAGEYDEIPKDIVGLSTSINLGITYSVRKRNDHIVVLNSRVNNGYPYNCFLIDVDPNKRIEINGRAERILYETVRTAFSYIYGLNSVQEPENDMISSCSGCIINILSSDLPMNRGLASSTCLIRAVMFELLRINGVYESTSKKTFRDLIQYVEEVINGTSAGTDIIVDEMPGLKKVTYHYDLKNGEVEYETVGKDYDNGLESSDFLRSGFYIIDTGEKRAGTNSIIKAIRGLIEDKDNYQSRNLYKDIINLFGETTTNYSNIAISIINSDISMKDKKKAIGSLMWEYQKQFSFIFHRSDLPEYLVDKESCELIKRLMDKNIIYGGKVMGSHGGACILVLTQESTTESTTKELQTEVEKFDDSYKVYKIS